MHLNDFKDVCRLMHVKTLYISSLYDDFIKGCPQYTQLSCRVFLREQMAKKPYLEFKENYHIKILHKNG